MKKLVYLALALCVMVAAFSGCGGKSDDGGNSSAVSSPPATVTPTPTPESQTAKALRVTADSGLNIRAEASTDGEILGLAENGPGDPLQRGEKERHAPAQRARCPSAQALAARPATAPSPTAVVS